MSNFIEQSNQPQTPAAFMLPDALKRLTLAEQFYNELSDSVEVFSDIVEQHGARTLSDLLHLHASIMSNGFIDAWPDSAVLDVVSRLPSADRWLAYASVYDENGLEKESIFAKMQAQTIKRESPSEQVKIGNTTLPHIGEKISVRVDGLIVAGVVTGHSTKDGKTTFDYEVDHSTPDGPAIKGLKWAWPEQLSSREGEPLRTRLLHSMKPLKDLEEAYVEAADELQLKQSRLQNYADALDSFLALRDELKSHPEFAGLLPKTYFSGSDLDPEGVDGRGSDGCDHPRPGR